uniref:Uncharacterized protein n=1 Tax=Geospiza parvula TaxID=87175 RepID=A0A8U8AKU8_GEOPR
MGIGLIARCPLPHLQSFYHQQRLLLQAATPHPAGAVTALSAPPVPWPNSPPPPNEPTSRAGNDLAGAIARGRREAWAAVAKEIMDLGDTEAITALWILPTSLGKREDERALQPPRPDTSSCCQRLSPASLQPATASLQPATTGSLGMDVASSVAVTLMTTQPEKVPTGIKGPIIIDGQPMGALLLGRSSATMMGLFVLPGVIDADFTGEICVMVYIPFPPIQIEKGQRIAQLVPLEQITKSLAPRQSQLRGERGFGSTGGLTLLTMNLNDWPKCTNSINKDIYSFLLVPGIPLSLLVKRSRGNIVCYMIYGL